MLSQPFEHFADGVHDRRVVIPSVAAPDFWQPEHGVLVEKIEQHLPRVRHGVALRPKKDSFFFDSGGSGISFTIGMYCNVNISKRSDKKVIINSNDLNKKICIINV